MRTSQIPYRVADFLKQFPPFDSLAHEDLLRLAAGGRVQFHESEEYVFRQSEPRQPFVYVIEQGHVELYEESDGGSRLADLLGEGDLFGLGGMMGAETYVFTARTASDVMLYALPAAELESLLRANPKSSRFLAAYFSVSGKYTAAQAKVPETAPTRADTHPFTGEAPVSCQPADPVRDVARLMARHGAEAAVVVNPEGLPLGRVTVEELRDLVATGVTRVDAPVSEVMRQGIATVPPDWDHRELLLELVRKRTRYLAVTRDGTPQSPVLSLVDGVSALAAASPAVLTSRLFQSSDLPRLAQLVNGCRSSLADSLRAPGDLVWTLSVAREWSVIVLERLVRLSEEELAAEGRAAPEVDSCWLHFGRAARAEHWMSLGLEAGVVYEDPPEGAEESTRVWFEELAARVARRLEECGQSRESEPLDSMPVRSLGEWKALYDGLLEDPIRNQIYRWRHLLDFRAAVGAESLEAALRNHLSAGLAQHGPFLRLLANDSMANLPPLTFFQGWVVDDAGARRQNFNIRDEVQQPLIEVARVLALDLGFTTSPGTLDRFRAAAHALGEQAALLQQAGDAFRFALFQEAQHSGLAVEGPVRINPLDLNRIELRYFKSVFRAILSLLEFVAERYQVIPPR